MTLNSKKSDISCVVRARETALRPVVVDCNSGDPETADTDGATDEHQSDVCHREHDFLRRVKVVAPVHVEPENAGKAEREPADEERALKTG